MSGPGAAAAASDRNAAIWYAADGFDPAARGINGRRVAGASFLKGYAAHAEADEIVGLVGNDADRAAFAAFVAEHGGARTVRTVSRFFPRKMAPLGTFHYPSPNFAAEVWGRARHGQAAYSICGITHTTASAAVMQGFYDLRMAPQADWDAVICTSQAVRASVLFQMELVEDHLKSQFAATLPARLQLPVIPLGVTCDDFLPDPPAGAALRARLGLGPQDVLFATIARLNPNVKFDPLPAYLALKAAQARVPGRRLHLVLCGVFTEDHGREVFHKAAVAVLGEGHVSFLDGADAAERRATLSGADVFLFPIDNVQETYGLAPVEAMAAGLPVIVSDWDGMKDTVTPEVGFRVATRTLTADMTVEEALRYHAGLDGYAHYCGTVATMTEIDLGELAARMALLAGDAGLRARMGKAGQARARALYDWRAVVPQMQDLWADLAARRRAGAAGARRYPAGALPMAPSPMALFAAYPTAQVRFGDERFAATDPASRLALGALIEVRGFATLKRMAQTEAHLGAVLAAIEGAGPAGIAAAALAQATGLHPTQAARCLIWLRKYGMIRPADRGAVTP
ncbi:MAG: glycosyltransferase family 4 protein [Proteobacteria bacterium]|nr:glycosyltransferase family 4 protein [Pseudomonadota bacterium]MBS0574306.1 glycosyltransferase family 4 protein [Pseudomonadota bacterium]